jgi:hypothetical protein
MRRTTRLAAVVLAALATIGLTAAAASATTAPHHRLNPIIIVDE